MDYQFLLALAEAKFQRWCGKNLIPRRDRLLEDVKRSKDLTTGGKLFEIINVYRRTLEREVRKRISFYGDVARGRESQEMLSKSKLDQYRERVMTSVKFTISSLRELITRYADEAGYLPDAARPSEFRFIHLEAKILDAVNDELGVLEAEGSLEANKVAPPLPHLRQDMPTRALRASKACNPGYQDIDKCLREIARTLPKRQVDVFAYLEGRVGAPNAQPFKSTKGWQAGFKKDPVRAGSWLSKRWASLRLAPLPRGPKK